MHAVHLIRAPRLRLVFAALSAVCLLTVGSVAAPQGTASYTILSAGGRRPLAVKAADPTDLVAVDQLVPIFGLMLREDALAGGLSIRAGAQTIVLTPNQPLASVGGRLISLSAPVVRDGLAWLAPLDLLSRVIGPALGSRIEIRRASHLILIGDIRVPQITVRFERQSGASRLTIDIQPAAPYRIARDGAHLTVRFTADAIDLGTVTGLPPDFVAGIGSDATALLIDLGPAGVDARPSEDPSGAHLTIDFLAAAPAGYTAQEPPVLPAAGAAGIRTVAIDPGHGGSDAGVHGPNDLVEKRLTATVALRLKAAIEGRLGLRVVLTRENDDEVAIDRRAAVANNNKADLLISLHANASMRPQGRGAQVYSLNLDDYKDRMKTLLGTGAQVPVAGGGMRTIDPIPWDYAQIPQAGASSTFGAIVVRHMRELGVPLHEPSLLQAPLRVLAGANMPAILVEMGFLSNADDARALAGDALQSSIVEALVAAVTEVRAGIPATTPGGGA